MDSRIVEHLEEIARLALGSSHAHIKFQNYFHSHNENAQTKRVKLSHWNNIYNVDFQIQFNKEAAIPNESIMLEPCLPLVLMELMWEYFGLSQLHLLIAKHRTTIKKELFHCGNDTFWQQVIKDPGVDYLVQTHDSKKLESLVRLHQEVKIFKSVKPKFPASVTSMLCSSQQVIIKIIKACLRYDAEDLCDRFFGRTSHTYHSTHITERHCVCIVLQMCQEKWTLTSKPWVKRLLAPHVYRMFILLIFRPKILPQMSQTIRVDGLVWLVRHFGHTKLRPCEREYIVKSTFVKSLQAKSRKLLQEVSQEYVDHENELGYIVRAATSH